VFIIIKSPWPPNFRPATGRTGRNLHHLGGHHHGALQGEAAMKKETWLTSKTETGHIDFGQARRVNEFLILCQEAETYFICKLSDIPLDSIAEDFLNSPLLHNLIRLHSQYTKTQNPTYAVKAFMAIRKAKKESNGMLYLDVPEWIMEWLTRGLGDYTGKDEEFSPNPPWLRNPSSGVKKNIKGDKKPSPKIKHSLEKHLGFDTGITGSTPPLKKYRLERRNHDLVFEAMVLQKSFGFTINEAINLVNRRYMPNDETDNSPLNETIRQIYFKSPDVKWWKKNPDFIKPFFSEVVDLEVKLQWLRPYSPDQKQQKKIMRKLFPDKSQVWRDNHIRQYFPE
jgi:hypothetical protein